MANNNASVLEEFTRCFILLIGMQFIDYIRATLTLKLANIKMTEVILYTHTHTINLSAFYQCIVLNGGNHLSLPLRFPLKGLSG